MSPGETLTGDDADCDVHVGNLTSKGGHHRSGAHEQSSRHHHQAVSKTVGQDSGERSCIKRAERDILSPGGISVHKTRSLTSKDDG